MKYFSMLLLFPVYGILAASSLLLPGLWATSITVVPAAEIEQCIVQENKDYKVFNEKLSPSKCWETIKAWALFANN